MIEYAKSNNNTKDYIGAFNLVMFSFNAMLLGYVLHLEYLRHTPKHSCQHGCSHNHGSNVAKDEDAPKIKTKAS